MTRYAHDCQMRTSRQRQISYYCIINHLHNFAITCALNMCTLAETLETVQLGNRYRMEEAQTKSIERAEFSESVHISTVIAKLSKLLIMEWQEIPNPLHIIRSFSIAQFLCSRGKRVSQMFWQYISHVRPC